MLFTTAAFVALLVACLGAYHLTPSLFPDRGDLVRSAQTGLLLVASFVFYGFNRPALALLLAFSVVMNATAAWLLVDPARNRTQRARVLAVGVAMNLGVLATFKYAALLADAILPAALEGDVLPALRGIPLPIGISFYTFQGISLLVDIHRDRGEVATRLTDLAGEGDRSGVRRGVRFTAHVGLYIAFFPQLIAGPIVRASQFFHQIEPKRPADIRWNLAGRALIGGYFLKMFVADNLAEHTAVLTSGEFDGFTKVDLLALVYGYSAQIFADFAGYSLIAIGLGHLFGYQLPVNFRTPYNSTSITEFWQRWHISLSSWLREYLYIPLGGNRRGRRRTAVNLLVVMVLGGLWHGASWNFAGWGLAHGLILAAERAVAGGRYGRPELVSAATRVPRILCTFTMVSLLWLFFVTPDASASADFFARLVTAPVGLSILNGGLANAQIYALALFVFPVVVHHVVALLGEQRTTPARRPASPARARGAVETTALGTMLFLVATNSGVTGEFIYFTF